VGNPGNSEVFVDYNSAMPPLEAARAFMDAVNRRSPEEVSRWMTEDHVFVDSLGNRVEGEEKMTAGWAGYFRMVPDYSIVVDEALAAGDLVAS
jgi:ketosteroid isomerase-like protein